jgi:DUF4097 and DUF4098 domain-containing protein YvlB
MPTFETPTPITAVIDTVGGHLWINASDRTDTAVDVRPADAAEAGDVQAAEQTRVEYAGGRLSVTTPKGRLRSLLGRPPSIDVTIDLPADSRVEVDAAAEIRCGGRIGASTFTTAAGSIRLDETGRLRLRTGAGDVSVARSAEHAEVTTSSGKVWIGEIDGTAVVKTANGDITLGEVTGDVRMTTANGDITVDRALATLAAVTANGNVRVGEVVRGAIVLKTGFGELEIGIPEGTAAWLDALSKHGSVRSDLDSADEARPSDETVKVRARTGFGDIVIRRS